MSFRSQFLILLITLLLIQASLAEQRLRLATTTSTDNSGLLAAINPVFTKQTGIPVDVIAVGTGKALRLASQCDVDAVLVHAPAAEQAFVERGYGIKRQAVMHNDFILVGPKSDPAAVRQTTSVTGALAQIARTRSPFVSRGDDSGTHKKEQQLWHRAGVTPSGVWYYAIGQGMGASLQFSHEKQAYTLTDRGTWLAMQDKVDLTIVFEGDPLLHNPYHIIAVNPRHCPSTNYKAAMRYAAFLTGPSGQQLIGQFKISGQPLFHPDALP